MNKDKLIHTLAIVVPALVALGMLFAPAKTPAYLHAAGLVFLMAAVVVNRFAVPPAVKDAVKAMADALAQAEAAGVPGAPAPGTAAKLFAMAKGKKFPAPVTMLMLLLACHATPQQVLQTVEDGVVAGGCIAGALLSGTDPMMCEGATEQFVVDVANDLTAKAAAKKISVTQAQMDNITKERTAAVVRMAQKGHAK